MVTVSVFLTVAAGVVIGLATVRIFNKELEKVAERLVERWME